MVREDKPAMTKIYLALALHNHQPVGNFDFVFEKAYEKAYEPMVSLLEKYPDFRITIHNTGCLLDWLIPNRPDYIERLKALVARGQVEIMTGGYYEPILVSLPNKDKRGQLQKLTRTVDRQFETTARGAWLAERVWEPQLPDTFASTGIDYTILDNTHFRPAGLGRQDLFGYYNTEENGKVLKLFATQQDMRYMIPWAPVDDVINYLREKADADDARYKHATKIAVMGDDGEKFGLWPNTYAHCWNDGWMERFVKAVLANSDWLTTTTFSDYIDSEPALGQVYIPTGSYDEMGQWSLPTDRAKQIAGLRDELHNREDVTRYLRGGSWRNFLVKYSEVNQMHKKMLWIGQKVHEMPRGQSHIDARDKLWAAQCNCAYWHGVFGGIYLFHIRGANYRNLIEAEMLANPTPSLALYDADWRGNGVNELILENRHQWLLFDPAHGGQLELWDYRDAPTNLLNTIMRREEWYHAQLIDAVAHGQAVLTDPNAPSKNIHGGQVKVKEWGLEKKLVYDKYRRAALQDCFLSQDESAETYASGFIDQGDFIGQPYTLDIVERARQLEVVMWREGVVGGQPVKLEKHITLLRGSSDLSVEYTITNLGDKLLKTRFGIENNFGLEGGQDSLTYFEGLGEGQRPGIAGSAPASKTYSLVSEISTVNSRISHSVSKKADVWWYPIETVSLSEDGFEANYQGTAILNSWLISLPKGKSWQVALKFELSTFLSK